MKKRLSALIVLSILSLSLFATGQNESPAKTTAATDGKKNEVVELTIAVINKNAGFPANTADDYCYQQILEKTGVALNFQVVDDYYTALNVRIAGGDCPDLFVSDSSHMRSFAESGDILDLTPYRDKEMAALMKWIGDTDINAYTHDGALYGVPKNYVNAQTYFLINIRQDWLDRLGLSIPKTVDELYDVAYAFTYNDPDGNGKNDTIGFSGKLPNGFEAIVNAYDTALGNYIIIRDGKVTNTLFQPHMKDALAMCKKFVDAGIVDPDIWTTNPRDKAISGSLGLLSLEWSVMFKQSYVDQIKAVNPNARWSFFGPLASEVGAAPAFMPIDPASSKNFCCVSADISEEKLAALWRLLDYLVTEEGSMLVDFGLKGVHWDYDAQGNAYMTSRASEANYVATYQIVGRDDPTYLNVKFKEAKDQIAYAQKMPHITIYNSLITEVDGFYLKDFESFVKNQLIAFIYGDRPISEYDKFLEECNKTYHFDKYMAACAKQLAALGYVK
jgi:putative aldouronate transport system substrate-binding protein